MHRRVVYLVDLHESVQDIVPKDINVASNGYEPKGPAPSENPIRSMEDECDVVNTQFIRFYANRKEPRPPGQRWLICRMFLSKQCIDRVSSHTSLHRFKTRHPHKYAWPVALVHVVKANIGLA